MLPKIFYDNEKEMEKIKKSFIEKERKAPPGVIISAPSEDQLLVETLKLIDSIQDLNRLPMPTERAEECRTSR